MTKYRDLYIYGYGGLGREILSLSSLVGGWDFKGFVDDDPQKKSVNKKIYSSSVLEELAQGTDVIISIADPQAKKNIYERLKKLENIRFPKLISPLAYIDPSSTIGGGCIVSHFCFVSCSTTLKEFTFLNVSCSIGHDATIGSFNSAMPGVAISGGVSTGECVFFGSKAFVLQGKTVSDNAFIGVGAIVTSDISKSERIYAPRSKKIKGD
ncbi:MAG: acetyltransferase [Synergistales bacterium]|nr:acetyltransferase [Synergistales bacterium]